MKYQIPPPPVTSYCHRSKAAPFHVADPQRPLQPMLPFRVGRRSGVRPNRLERSPQIGRRILRQLVPARAGFGFRETNFEFLADRGRSGPVTTFRTHREGSSGSGSGTGPRSPSGSRVRISSNAGSAWISAVCRHCVNRMARGARFSSAAAPWATATNSARNWSRTFDTPVPSCGNAERRRSRGSDAVRKISDSENHLMILVTRPAPTVRPPSRMAKRRPSSMATGWISLTSISVLSPGMTISVPSGRVTTPVTSVVRK